jgi:hypothetical protein
MLYFSYEVIYSNGWPMKIVEKIKWIYFILTSFQNMFVYYIKES